MSLLPFALDDIDTNYIYQLRRPTRKPSLPVAKPAVREPLRLQIKIGAVSADIDRNASRIWYERGCYERWGHDWHGQTYVLADSEEDDRRFENELAYHHERGEWLGTRL